MLGDGAGGVGFVVGGVDLCGSVVVVFVVLVLLVKGWWCCWLR